MTLTRGEPARYPYRRWKSNSNQTNLNFMLGLSPFRLEGALNKITLSYVRIFQKIEYANMNLDLHFISPHIFDIPRRVISIFLVPWFIGLHLVKVVS